MNVGADFSGLGLLPQLTEEVPKSQGAQFESLLVQQLVHAMVQGSGLDQNRGADSPGGSYLSMMEGLLTHELAQGQQLGVAKALGLGDEP